MREVSLVSMLTISKWSAGAIFYLKPTAKQRWAGHTCSVLRGVASLSPSVQCTIWRTSVSAGWSGGPAGEAAGGRCRKMPKKKGKKKGGKGKKKAAKLKAAAEREEAMVKCKLFMKAYQTHCAASDSSPSPKILKACRESVEEDKSLCKVRVSWHSLLLRFRKCLDNPPPRPYGHSSTVVSHEMKSREVIVQRAWLHAWVYNASNQATSLLQPT